MVMFSKHFLKKKLINNRTVVYIFILLGKCLFNDRDHRVSSNVFLTYTKTSFLYARCSLAVPCRQPIHFINMKTHTRLCELDV